MLAKEGIVIWNYIDNTFTALEAEEAGDKFQILCDLITDLGLPLNPDKVQPPSDSIEIMGVEVNAVLKTIAIPQTKLADIVRTVDEFSRKTFMSKKELQSLLGKLLYISKIIRPARGFLNRMLQTLRNMSNMTRIKIDEEFTRDLNWFRVFVRTFNGRTSFANWEGPSDIVVHIDASLAGLGAVCSKKFYSVHLPDHIKALQRIVIFEMLNILIALRVWGDEWCNMRVTCFCDNRAVVDVLEDNRTKDRWLGLILREILMLQAKLNIQLKVLHVRGEANPIADALSRVHMRKSDDCINALLDRGYEESMVDIRQFHLDNKNL